MKCPFRSSTTVHSLDRPSKRYPAEALYHWIPRLAEARTRAGRSLVSLERATGVAAWKFQEAERTERLVIQGRELVLLANHLEVSLDWLTGRDDYQGAGGGSLAALMGMWSDLTANDRELVVDFARTLVST